jgi:hypothetical protein
MTKHAFPFLLTGKISPPRLNISSSRSPASTILTGTDLFSTQHSVLSGRQVVVQSRIKQVRIVKAFARL